MQVRSKKHNYTRTIGTIRMKVHQSPPCKNYIIITYAHFFRLKPFVALKNNMTKCSLVASIKACTPRGDRMQK